MQSYDLIFFVLLLVVIYCYGSPNVYPNRLQTKGIKSKDIPLTHFDVNWLHSHIAIYCFHFSIGTFTLNVKRYDLYQFTCSMIWFVSGQSALSIRIKNEMMIIAEDITCLALN